MAKSLQSQIFLCRVKWIICSVNTKTHLLTCTFKLRTALFTWLRYGFIFHFKRNSFRSRINLWYFLQSCFILFLWHHFLGVFYFKNCYIISFKKINFFSCANYTLFYRLNKCTKWKCSVNVAVNDRDFFKIQNYSYCHIILLHYFIVIFFVNLF